MTPRFKHWFFANHWNISLVLLFLTSSVIAALRAWELLYPSVGAVLGLSYFAQKQHLEETRLFKELFCDFNARYDRMNEQLYALLDAPPDQALTRDESSFLYDYFNLCAEEYLYYRKGYIDLEVWIAWQNGMKIFYSNPRIRALWDTDLQTNSYYGFSTACLLAKRNSS